MSAKINIFRQCLSSSVLAPKIEKREWIDYSARHNYFFRADSCARVRVNVKFLYTRDTVQLTVGQNLRYFEARLFSRQKRNFTLTRERIEMGIKTEDSSNNSSAIPETERLSLKALITLTIRSEISSFWARHLRSGTHSTSDRIGTSQKEMCVTKSINPSSTLLSIQVAFPRVTQHKRLQDCSAYRSAFYPNLHSARAITISFQGKIWE